jgi:tetratricopeptide (TPR) repeat protein
MLDPINKRILFLPFISGNGDNGALDIEYLITQAIEYKLSVINNIKVVDIRQKAKDTPLRPVDNTYSLAAIRVLADRYHSSYALVGKFDTGVDGLATQCYIDFYHIINFEVIGNWESSVGAFTYISSIDYDINTDLFNDFINDSVNRIIELMGIEIDYLIKQFLDEPLVKNPEAFKALVHAKKLAQTNDERLRKIEEALKHNPKMELAFAEKAKIYKQRRKYNEAIEYYNSAIEFAQSDCHRAYYYTDAGSAYAQSGDFGQAIEYWEKAINLYPGYINPYMNLALAYEENGDFAKAEEYLLDIQNLSPTDCRTYLGLARLYSKTENWLKAIGQYNNLLKLQPADAWSHSNIANCYLQVGKNKEAKNFFYKTLELDPEGEAGSYASQVIKALEEASKKDWWKFWRR